MNTRRAGKKHIFYKSQAPERAWIPKTMSCGTYTILQYPQSVALLTATHRNSLCRDIHHPKRAFSTRHNSTINSLDCPYEKRKPVLTKTTTTATTPHLKVRARHPFSQECPAISHSYQIYANIQLLQHNIKSSCQIGFRSVDCESECFRRQTVPLKRDHQHDYNPKYKNILISKCLHHIVDRGTSALKSWYESQISSVICRSCVPGTVPTFQQYTKPKT